MEKKMDLKHKKSGICYIAAVLFFLYLIISIFVFIFWAIRHFAGFSWFWFLAYNSVYVWLGFIYFIGLLKSKVDALEQILIKKKIIDIEKDDDNFEVDIDKVKVCPHCGFQVFPEDKKCKYCGKELKNNKNK